MDGVCCLSWISSKQVQLRLYHDLCPCDQQPDNGTTATLVGKLTWNTLVLWAGAAQPSSVLIHWTVTTIWTSVSLPRSLPLQPAAWQWNIWCRHGHLATQQPQAPVPASGDSDGEEALQWACKTWAWQPHAENPRFHLLDQEEYCSICASETGFKPSLQQGERKK